MGKGALTTREGTILRTYVEAHGLRPQLSLPAVGLYHFLDSDDELQVVSMQTMKAEYEATKAAEKLAKKRRQA